MEEVDIESIEFTDEEVEMYDLQVKDNHNFILENDIITHNSGKTFFLRGMIDRLNQCPVVWVDENKKKRYDIGYNICYLNDCKDELKSSKNPVQGKFRNKLLPGEEPQGLKVAVMRPTFFREFSKILPEDNAWMSINIAELQKRDFMTLLKADQLTEAQQTLLEILYDNMKKKPEFKLSDIPEMIDQLGSDFKPSQLQALKNKFKPLLTNDFGNSLYNRNLKIAMDKGYVLSLNLESQEFYSSAGINYPPVFIGIVMRNLIALRREGKIKPLFLFMDEAARFIANNINPSCKHDVLESVDIDRRYNISWGVCSQAIHDLPEKIVMQSRYIFIPFNADTTIIKEALISTGLITRGFLQNASNDAARLRRQMTRWDWLVIDRTRNRYDIIKPLSPLSNHLETK
jgi:uncharacterized protein YnzC (UPF0291/DUF896 family)